MKNDPTKIGNLEKSQMDTLEGLLIKKNSILKKYRKKFEEIKINQLKNGLFFDNKQE